MHEYMVYIIEFDYFSSPITEDGNIVVEIL